MTPYTRGQSQKDGLRAWRERQGAEALLALADPLARFEPGMGLVDDVDAPLAAHDTAVLVALFQRLKRIDNLHARIPRQGPEDRERAGRSQIRRADRHVCAACDRQ